MALGWKRGAVQQTQEQDEQTRQPVNGFYFHFDLRPNTGEGTASSVVKAKTSSFFSASWQTKSLTSVFASHLLIPTYIHTYIFQKITSGVCSTCAVVSFFFVT